MAFKIADGMIYVDVSSSMQNGSLCVEDLKAEVACVYFLQLSDDRRVKGIFKMDYLPQEMHLVVVIVLYCV